MKKYNVKNYLRYKDDLKTCMPADKEWQEYTRNELIIKFMPLVENIARKFATSEQASGILSINDLIQEGNVGLVRAVDKIIWTEISRSEDVEKTIKSFLSKRIKGSIRRAIDINRGNIKIPEHKLLQIRKDAGKDKKLVRLFFNSMFLSIDERIGDEDDFDSPMYQIEDKSENYNIGILNKYLMGLLKKYLDYREYEVLRLSYGLDCDKHGANAIAEKLDIQGASAYVRVSEIKKQAVQKLIDNVNPAEVLDYF